MPSTTLVCFDCRTTKREISIACTTWERDRPSCTCQHCGQDMHRVTSSIPVPKKSDDRGWKEMLKHVSKWNIVREEKDRWWNTQRCMRLRDEAKNSKV